MRIAIMWSQSVRYILLATVLFTSLNICVKYLPHIPTSQLVFFRGLMTLMICGVYARRNQLPILGQNKPILILRGLFGTLSLFALFYCLQKMPLALASVLSNLAPLFTVIIAHFFLRERATWVNALLLLVAFAGVLLVKGWESAAPWALAFVGIGGALFAACAYTCVRVLRTTDHPMIVMIYFPLISVPLMIFPMWNSWVTPSVFDWLLMATIGVLTQWAQYFMTVAYQQERAANIMIYNYAGVVWSIVAGYLLFQETLTARQMLGILIIFCAIFLTAQVQKGVSIFRGKSLKV